MKKPLGEIKIVCIYYRKNFNLMLSFNSVQGFENLQSTHFYPSILRELLDFSNHILKQKIDDFFFPPSMLKHQ